MVNILRFPGRRSAAAERGENVAAAGAGSNAPALEGKTARSPGHGDWSNQELADLYRVEALIVQSINIRIETDRGVTDEADPWFVFCRPDGEVFVHLCRINRRYILDSPGVGAVLEGADFAALIDEFVRRTADRSGSENLSRLGLGRSHDPVIRLHPAAMLAALIWSLYLASDHLSGEAQAAEIGSAGATGGLCHPIPATLLGDEARHALANVEAALSRHGPADHRPVVPGSRDETYRMVTAPDMRSLGSSLQFNSAGIAASLTAIAITFGLYDEKMFEHPTEDATVHGEEAPLPVEPLKNLSKDGMIIETKGDHPETPAAVGPHVAANDAPLPETSRQASHDVTPAPLTVERHAPAEVAPAHNVTIPTAKIAMPTTETATVAHTSAPSPQDTDGTKEMQSIVNFATQHLGQANSYKIGDLSISATFDISSLDRKTTDIVLEDSQPPHIPPSSAESKETGDWTDIPGYYQVYDEQAKNFVHNFLLKSSSIEMIKTDNAVIFIDTTAIDDPSDHAYSRSWVFDGHFVVSTIGHAQDFADITTA